MGLQLSGSVQLEGNLLVTGSANSVFENISVTNRITANEINVQFVSSSIIYSSGSNRFGDEVGDKHQFTGSLVVSGTLAMGTDNTGYGRISFNESSNTLRIQSSKNGTDCTPIEFWSQKDGGGFAQSMIISGSNTGLGGHIPNASYGPLQIKSPASSYTLDLVGRTAGLNGESQISFWNAAQSTVLASVGNIGGKLLIDADSIGIGGTPTNGKLEVQTTTSASAALWVQTGGTTSDYVIADFRTGTNAPALQILGNANSIFQGSVGIGTPTPTERFNVNVGGGARAGMALTGEYPYLKFNVTSSSANSRNWAFSATNLEAGDFALLQSNAKDGDPVNAGTRILDFTRSGNTIVSGSLTVGKGITVSSEAFGNFFGKFGAASTALLELREFTGDQTATTLILRSSRTNSGNLYAHIQAFSDSTTQVFRVLANGVVDNLTGVYGSLSDIKLKENIVDATPKLEDLLKVKIRNYNLIGDETKQIGVIAQELEETFPGLVSEYEDFEEVEITDEEGNVTKEKQPTGTTTKSVKYSIFVPMLIKAIQEQQSQIEELKTKVEQLQNN
jgi:hypothetical protein